MAPSITVTLLFALATTLLSASAAGAQPGPGHRGADLASPSGPSATPSEPATDAMTSLCGDLCSLRPFFRATLGAGAGIIVPVGIEGLGRLELVVGHDIQATPRQRLQVEYRVVGLGNQIYLGHRHVLGLGIGFGSVFSAHAGVGGTFRHIIVEDDDDFGTIFAATMSFVMNWTLDAFVISLDLCTLDLFLPAAVEWTPSLSFGFQIR